LQCTTTEHVDDPLVEERDFGWFKIRQNLDPFQESKRVLGVGKPGPMFLRPPVGDSITEACKQPWRKLGDDIHCFI
jgi:hypothetical protein